MVLRFSGSVEMSMPVISVTFLNMVALDILKDVHVRRKCLVSSGTEHTVQSAVIPTTCGVPCEHAMGSSPTSAELYVSFYCDRSYDSLVRTMGNS